MKKFIVILLVVLLVSVGALVGCTPKEEDTTEPAKTEAKTEETKTEEVAADPDAVLKYWCSWGGDSQEWDKWRVGEFTKATGIEVDNQYVEPDGGISNGKLLAAIAGGTPPDIVVTSAYSESYTYAVQGSLLEWDPYLEDIGVNADELLPGFKPLMEYNGKTYIMPQDSNVIFLYYNPQMFIEAGLDPNDPPETLDELDAMAEKLNVIGDDGKVERFGFIPWVDTGGDAFVWPWMFGAQIYDPETNQLNLTEDKMVDCYNWQNSYAQKYDPEKMKAFVSGFGGMFSPDHPFMQGKVAMTVTGNWFTNALRIYAPDLEYMVTKIPTPPGGRTGGSTLNTNVFLMPKGAENPALGAQFFKFIISPQINANNFDTWRSIPIKDADFDEVSWTKENDPVYAVEREIANSPNSGHPAVCGVSSELSVELNALRDSVIYNNNDPEPLLDELQQRLQPELDKFAK